MEGEYVLYVFDDSFGKRNYVMWWDKWETEEDNLNLDLYNWLILRSAKVDKSLAAILPDFCYDVV